MKYTKKILAVLAVCFCLSFLAVPAMKTYASSIQTETQAAGADTQVSAGETDEDQATFMIIMLGGGLLVILVAVIAAVSTVSSAVAVAANMDVDGE